MVLIDLNRHPANRPRNREIKMIPLPVVVVILSVILFAVSHAVHLSSQYISFYVVIELISIFMGFSIALTLWYTYEYSEGYLRILGSFFLTISCLKLFHALSFPGMPQFLIDNSGGKNIWFWVLARLLEAIVLFISGLVEYYHIRINFSRLLSFSLACALLVFSLLFVSNYSWFFAQSWIETGSQSLSGVIIICLLAALLFFWDKFKKSGQKNVRFLICGIITSIFAELALSFHSVESDAFNLLGHLYKLVSYVFIFHILFGQTVRKPFEDLEKLLNQTVSSVSRALDRRDKYTYNHSVRVAEYACVIGGMLKVDKRLHENLRLSGLLHDIGKIAVPDSVLNKEGPLTEEEREMIKQHPVRGAEILEPVEQLQVLRGVSEHHERFDGKGYPGGIAGEAISLEARVLAVADTFDAITSNRVYRSKKSKEEAIAILVKASGTQLDTHVVKAFLRADQLGLVDPIMTK